MSDADLRNVRDVSAGAWGGFGWDIALNPGSRSLWWYLTPFVEGSWLYDQKKADAPLSEPDKAWTTLTARAGVQVKLGLSPSETMATPPPAAAPSLSVTVHTPQTGVLQPRDLIEHMPLVDYLFFDKGSTEIPTRYARLTPESAASFDERRLVAAATTGSASATQPEERQMQVYYNMLNILGRRMADNIGFEAFRRSCSGRRRRLCSEAARGRRDHHRQNQSPRTDGWRP